MGDEHQRRAVPFLQIKQRIDDHRPGRAVEIARGFVRQQDLRARRRRPRQRHPLLLSARQLRGVVIAPVAEAERGSRFLGLLAAELARRGTLERRFSPDPDPYFSNHPLLDEDEEVSNWPHVFSRVLRARAVGPVIEVYRVP